MTHDKLITCTFAQNSIEWNSDNLVGLIPLRHAGTLMFLPSVVYDTGQ